MATISNLSIDQGASFSTTVTVNAPDASTTLNGALNNSATTITVHSTVGFPDVGTIKIENETITYTGTGATSFTGATRGASSSTAASHATTTAVTYTAGAIDLTGYTVLGQIRKTYESATAVTMATTVTNATSGQIAISLTDTQSTALSAGRYQWDLKITGGSGTVTRVVEGVATINPSVSRS